jgi:hypothetical protein
MKSKGRVRLFSIVVVLLLMCAAALSVVLQPAAITKAAAPSGLHVVGNQIQTSSGSRFIPHGVNRMGTEYACPKSATEAPTNFDGPVDQASVNAMLSWGITTVRVPLNEDCWLGINGLPANGTTSAKYQQDIISWVNLLNQNNLVVIVEMHWNGAGSTKATGQQPMPDLDHAPAFWTSVANTFKSNSSVIFDLYNEPYTTSWDCWKNGSTSASASPCTDVGFAVAGMQTLVNTVRATGATNIIMLGGLAYSNNISSWLTYKPTDSQNNLVASVHIYNFNSCANSSCWDSQIAPVAAQVPVIAGELGENDCASSFINTLTTWLDQHSTGYLAWTWTVADCSQTPALISDYSGTATNYGAGYKSHLLSLGGTTPTPTTGVTPTPTPTTPTSGACRVSYTVNQWQGGFTANITITNTSSSAINGWKLVFSFPGSQLVTQGWSGVFAQSGSQVTITNASYNAAIPANGSANPGFNGSWSGSNPSPTAFQLNGTACSIV